MAVYISGIGHICSVPDVDTEGGYNVNDKANR